jgi:chemotaxis protein methyltransferase CheR
MGGLARTYVSSSEPGSALPGLVPISDREFRLFQGLIEREAGIHLSPIKKALLAGRLSRRLRELGLRSFLDYYERVSSADGREERVCMIEAICTHETRFFREPQQFRFLEERIYPDWKAEAASGRRPRRISVWSAEAGIWPLERSAEIPSPYLKRFMLKGTRAEAGRFKAGSELRAHIRFGSVNLSSLSYPTVGRFDLIFCRNVLIYFSPESRRAVIQRLVKQHLDPAGYLLLGHAETVHDLRDRLRAVGPAICSPAAAPASRGVE